MFRDIIFIREKWSGTTDLQDTFSSIHDCNLIFCHQLFACFLVIQSKRLLITPRFRSVIQVKFQRQNEEIKADNAELEKTYVDTKQSYNSLLAKNSQLIFENEDLEQEKERRLSGNRELEKQQQKLQKELEAMAGSKVALERNVRAYDEEKQWQLPEPGVMQSAKSYREKVALPLITRLKELVKSLTIKCVGLMEQVKKLTAKVNQQGEDIAWYKNKIKEQNSTMEHLQEKAEDLERVKQYVGADKIQDIIDNVKEAERLQAEQKRLQRSYQNRMSR